MSASEERLLLGLNGSEPHKDAGESDGDVSPDLPWAEEVCREADSKTLAQDHSLMKRSRSLEQLLQACQLTEPLNSVRTCETTGPVVLCSTKKGMYIYHRYPLYDAIVYMYMYIHTRTCTCTYSLS